MLNQIKSWIKGSTGTPMHDLSVADRTKQFVDYDDVVQILEDAEQVFLDRHNRRGLGDMTLGDAINYIEGKIKRIKAGDVEDSAVDIIGYGIMIGLMNRGQWKDRDALIQDESVLDLRIDSAPKLLIKMDEKAQKYEVPSPKKKGDVGYDMYCTEDIEIPAYKGKKDVRNVPSGLSMKLPEGYWAEIRPRSSTAKRGLEVTMNTIDNGYTGPLFTQVRNLGNRKIKIKAGERLAQIVIHKIHTPKVEVVNELPETERGDSGFGSTGM